MSAATGKGRVLLVGPLQPNLVSGGNCLMAWTVQALCGERDVVLVTWDPFDAGDADKFYGTQLRHARFETWSMPASVRRLFALIRNLASLGYLRRQLIFRRVRQMIATSDFDFVLGVIDEMDVGVPAVQYVHFPAQEDFVSAPGTRWHHQLFLLGLYRRLAGAIAPHSREGIAKNRTLVNSDWTGRHYAAIYGASAETVYPPVPGESSGAPFEERECGFICLGRLEPYKQIVRIIEILDAVRAHGHAVTLHIVGSVVSPEYYARLSAMARTRSDWLTIHPHLPRQQLVELMGHMRFAIHAMENEHFGIAPAELQRAGCITFVPDSGGVTEVVDGDERVIYRSVDDAVAKICRFLSDADYARAVAGAVAVRKDRFSVERFMAEIRRVLAE